MRRCGNGAIFLILLPFLFTPPARAISDNAGTKNGAFLKIATDARGVALGPSMVALVEGADAMRWNPAALGPAETKEIAASHLQYYQDIHIENLSAAIPIQEGTLGANLFYLSPGTLDGRDGTGNPTGDFKFYDFVGGVGYGRRIRTASDGMEVSVGGAVKMVQEKISDQSFQNFAVDAGLLAAPWEDVKAGLAIRNLSSGKANFAKDLTLGVSYAPLRSLLGAVAVRYTDDAPLRFNVSGEYRYSEYNTALRASYTTHDTVDDSLDSSIPALRHASLAGLSFGAGFDYKPPIFPSLGLTVDYAMTPFGALGISHTVTLRVRW